MNEYMNDKVCKPNKGCVYRQVKKIAENTWTFIYVEESELKNKEGEKCFFCGKEANANN